MRLDLAQPSITACCPCSVIDLVAPVRVMRQTEGEAGWRTRGHNEDALCCELISIVSSILGHPAVQSVIRILEDQGQARHHSPVHQRFTARRPRDAFSSRAPRTGSRLGQADDIGLAGPRTIGQALFFVHTVLVMMAAHHLSSPILILLLPISLHIPGETVPGSEKPSGTEQETCHLVHLRGALQHHATTRIRPRRLSMDMFHPQIWPEGRRGGGEQTDAMLA